MFTSAFHDLLVALCRGPEAHSIRVDDSNCQSLCLCYLDVRTISSPHMVVIVAMDIKRDPAVIKLNRNVPLSCALSLDTTYSSH